MIKTSPRPMTVISIPLSHGLKPVTIVLASPIIKCDIVLIENEKIIAEYPPIKKNGTIGMKAPAAVDKVAEKADIQGLG